ncbi:MAG: ABC transporter permease subunit [Cyanobium sp. LacPavin_0818_WC50_MAG_67_9]|nr:ABC transporter permease subunit [Cyanobium sp. LacPavin_0818_WC50_MAG_67_9]
MNRTVGRRGTRLLLALVVMVGLLLTSGTGIGLRPARANTPWQVGVDPTYPPFEMQAADTGELTGLDVELMREIGRRSGHPIQFVELPFSGLIPALQSRNLDAAASAMTITAERAQTVDFSRPYFAAGLAIAVRNGSPDLVSLDALKGRKVAVQIGSTGAKAVQAVPGVTVVQFDAAPLALQELINGNVEAYVNDLPATLYAIREAKLQGVRIAGKPLTADFYGIALPKGSPLVAEINRALDSMLADGSYDSLHRRWFNQPAPPLPLVAPALAQGSGEAQLNPRRLGLNLLRGAGVTLALTVLSFGFGLAGACLLAFSQLGRVRIMRWTSQLYIAFFRGTPMLVQLFLIYFGLPALCRDLGLPFSLDRFVAAVLALSLNGAAYMAETLRGGIESIDASQWDAADALAMNPIERMRFVIFPQALRRVLPPLANEGITLIKDTSLAAVIGFDELFREGQLMVATTYRAFEIYIAVAIVYLVMTSTAAALFRGLERRLSPPA